MNDYVYQSAKPLQLPWGFYPSGAFFAVNQMTAQYNRYFNQVPFTDYVKALPVKGKLENLERVNGRYVLPIGSVVRIGTILAIVRPFPRATRPQDAHLICQFCGGCKVLKVKRKIKCCNNSSVGEEGFVWLDKLDNTKVFQRIDFDLTEGL